MELVYASFHVKYEVPSLFWYRESVDVCYYFWFII